MLDIANNSAIQDGDTIWLGFQENGDWTVYRYTKQLAEITGVFVSAPGSEITFVTDSHHNLQIGDIISVVRFNVQVNGVYIVNSIVTTNQFTVATSLSSIENDELLNYGFLYKFEEARYSDLNELSQVTDLLKLISIAVREMSEGELLQIEKARRLDITEAIYYEIIRQKTATLIAACCSLGACSVVPDDHEVVEKMRKFGELIGMAFQIKDDLFDYTDDAIGKPTGIDIKEQKMTLPLIYTLNHCTPKEKSWIINSIKNHNKDKKRVAAVIQFVKDKNGLTYAEQKMLQFQQEALVLLQEFPESDYKSALVLMVNYVIERKK